jgi:hypothetical protein
MTGGVCDDREPAAPAAIKMRKGRRPRLADSDGNAFSLEMRKTEFQRDLQGVGFQPEVSASFLK